MAESKMAEFKMVAIIKLIRLNYFESQTEWRRSVFEWIWEKIKRCLNPGWQCLNPTWQNSRWQPSSSWVRMNKWRFLCKMAESKMAEFKMAAIIKLSQNEWVKFFLCKMVESMIELSSWVRMNEFESDWTDRVLCNMAESKAEFNMEEFKLVTIIKLIRLN